MKQQQQPSFHEELAAHLADQQHPKPHPERFDLGYTRRRSDGPAVATITSRERTAEIIAAQQRLRLAQANERLRAFGIQADPEPGRIVEFNDVVANKAGRRIGLIVIAVSAAVVVGLVATLAWGA